MLALLYVPRFPFLPTPDTHNQWQQVHGELRYNTIHAIGHTIYLKALLSLDWMREHKNPGLIWENDGDPEIAGNPNLEPMNNRSN